MLRCHGPVAQSGRAAASEFVAPNQMCEPARHNGPFNGEVIPVRPDCVDHLYNKGARHMDLSTLLYAAGGIAIAVLLFFTFWFAIFRRVVVPTNEVHIVQRAKATVSYGSKLENGNVYYKWPEFIPKLGLTVRVLPTSVFDVNLTKYDAYDQHRVPFVVDVVAFFRVADSNMAAQRVASTDELYDQLEAIVQGAVRTTLAKHEIDEIMSERAKFGEFFTNEVQEQLKAWGVETVKNIELMDVRDAQGSNVIHDIMAKRTSEIQKDSRIKVAENTKLAETAEIEAEREVNLRKEDARQQVGKRQAEVERDVGVAKEQSRQAVQEQAAATAERTMEVKRVEATRQAAIDKDVAVVEAQQKRETDVINAEGEKQEAILLAEGHLESERRRAEAVQLNGVAKAEAEKALQMAPVAAQIALAQEIGSNTGYQTYLVDLKKVEAAQAIGVEQAKALENAEIKINALSSGPSEGLSGVMDLFSAKGGANLGMALEAIKNVTGKDSIKDVVTG